MSQKDAERVELDDRQKFIVELEFVQSLANPAYLSFLAQNGHFEDDKFVAYLKYLQYWTRPEHSIFITYPNGLVMLKLLQDVEFRRQLKDPECIAYIHRQQFYIWLNKRNKDSAS